MKKHSYSLDFFGDIVSWDSSSFVSWIIGFSSYILLVFLLRNSEPSFDNLEIGTPSPINVVAQSDFVYYDQEQTWKDLQEAVKNLDNVYRVGGIEHALEDLEVHLRNKNFSDQEVVYGLQVAKSTLNKLSEMIFASHKTLSLLNGSDKNVSDRVLSLSSLSINTNKAHIPEQFWHDAKGNIDNSVMSFVDVEAIDFLSNISWVLQKDCNYEKKIKDTIYRKIPKRFSLVNSGTFIVESGEVVSSTHMIMIRAMRKAILAKNKLWSLRSIFGILCFSLSVVVAGKWFIESVPQIAQSNRHILLLISICNIYFFLCLCLHKVFLDNLLGTFPMFVHAPLISPIIGFLTCSIYPIYVSSTLSFFCTVMMVIFLPVDPVKFLAVNMPALIVLLVNRLKICKKKDLIFIVMQIWVVVGLSIAWIHSENRLEVNYKLFAEESLFFLFSLSVLAISVVVVLPLIETIFDIVTENTVAEYTDPNHPLLKRLSIEAPGTYQHSLFVAHLAETAAAEIGCRPMFCRAVSLFHDVGKLENPSYFIENQLGVNMHQFLEPHDSAKIIISHINHGVVLADHYGLPRQFVDIIKEHHGTGLVYYFYRLACNKCGNENVDESRFRYSGPRPTSKESVIIMLSDCLEAASRSLDSVSKETVSAMFDKLLSDLINDGQLSNSVMSFVELEKIKRVMVSTVVASSHVRCKYPGK